MKKFNLNSEAVYFTYNTKSHKYGISYGPKEDVMIMSKAKAEAVIAFLIWIGETEYESTKET